MENQLRMKEQQVNALESQADHLRKMEPEKIEEIERRRAIVAERSVLLLFLDHTFSFLCETSFCLKFSKLFCLYRENPIQLLSIGT